MDEKELISKARSGDEKALNKLMTAYKSLVTSITRKYFLINAEQSDLVQEGMLGLFNAYRTYKFDSGVSFKTYASLCIKRQVQSAFIKNNRQKNQMLNTYFSINNQGKILLSHTQDKENVLEDDNGFYLEAKNLSPEESVLFREKLNELGRKIDESLSGFEKKVLRYYMSGLNYIEIANKLKKDSKSIDNALSRIKIKLKFLKGED